MATGITKREQLGADALAASDVLRECMPLPRDGTPVTLNYEGKVDERTLASLGGYRFRSADLKGKFGKDTQIIPDNSFVLTDNFAGLLGLMNSGKKVDLFYLDPPYATGMDFHSRDLEHAYKDSMGSAAYLEFMRRRLIIMRECMSSDASIYVHIGYQMVAQLKIIMDEIFGESNFRNIITRRKCSSKNFTRNQFSNINDYILFYTKSNTYKWFQPGEIPDESWIEKEYPKIDQYGRRYKLVPVHAPGTRNGETGKAWRGKMPPPGKHWQYAPSKLDELDSLGDIHWSKNGNPRRKVYWSNDKKLPLSDYWPNFRDAHHQSIKITGYPTEKNFEMLKMIIGASSDVGDFVVDPFCGSGTTIHAAMDLNRRFMGFDSSFTAAKATLKRFRHGVEAMGDYVDKQETLNQTHQKKTKHDVLHFLVESSLVDSYKKEVEAIAKI